MASTVCNALSKNIASRKCTVSGGVKNRVWVFQRDDITGAITKNATTNAISSFGLETGAQVITATSKAKKGKGDSKLTQAVDAGVSIEQSLALSFAYNSQPELDNIIAFLQADGKVVFQETNAGTIRIYFWEFGHESAEGDDTTGQLIADPGNLFNVTLKGTETSLPLFFEAPISTGLSQLESSIAYLDGLVTGN